MSRSPRIKLQWGASSVTPGDWYLGLIGLYRRKGARGKSVAISIRGLLVWGILASSIGYFSAAGYYWWKQQKRPYNFIHYTDVVLYPLSADKRREVRELQGQSMIAEGLDAFAAKQWGGAMMNLALGLERYPRDLTARLKLTQIFLGMRLRGKAQDTLLQGLDFGWPGRAYLQSAIEMASAGEDYEMVLVVCERALALHDPARHPAADRRWLAEQRIRALIAEKRNDEALAYAEKETDAVGDKILSELHLLALLQAGRFSEAVSFGEAWVARADKEPQALRLLARSYREAGRPEDMKRVLSQLRSDAPADPKVYVYAMIQYLLAGLEQEGRAMLDDYIFRFGGTEANFILAAEPLAEIDRAAELDILLAAAAERGFHEPRLLATKLQVLLSGRRWTEAARQITDIRAALTPAAAARAGMLDFYQYLVAAASDPADGAQSSFIDYVRERQLPMGIYRQSIEILRNAGRVDTARQLITFAQGVYPTNKYLEETGVVLAKEIADRRAAEEAARPVVAAVAAFATPKAFFAELDRVAAKDGVEAALGLLHEMRNARPAWFADNSEAIDRRELDLHVQQDDIAAIQGAARSYLTAERARIQYVVTLATRFHDAKRDPEARMLLNEILRKVPGDTAVTSLLARWFPAPPTSVSAPTAGSKTPKTPKAPIAPAP